MIRFFLLFLGFFGHAALGLSTLQFWHSMTGEKGKLLQELVTEFNLLPESKGRVEIQPQFVGTYEEAINKVRTSLLAKRGPHIAQITDIGTQMMVDSGATVPLQDFIAGDPTFPLKELLPQLVHYYEVNGKLRSLPFATSNPIIYYNVDAFQRAGLKRPPATFAELERYSQILSDPNAKRTGITWPLHSWFFEQFLARQGIPLTNNDNGRKGRATQVNFLIPEAIDFLSLWARMVKNGSFANVGRGWDPAEQNFLAGRSAMLITSTSDVFEIIRKAPFRTMTAPLPARDPRRTGGTIIGGNSLWIMSGKPPAEQKLAYEFIRFMAGKAPQKKWHTQTGYFPIRSDLIADLEKEGFYAKFPAAKTAITQLQESLDSPATRGALIGVFAEVRESVDSAIENILSGKMDPTKAMTRAKAQSEAALARYYRIRERASLD